MKPIKLFVYPAAKRHTQDEISPYYNTVPFSEKGIKDHCIVVDNPDEADYFYMGQISDSNSDKIKPEDFAYLRGNECKHIADLEGDFLGKEWPLWIKGCVLTGNGVTKNKISDGWKIYPRPCMSVLLVNLAKTDNIQWAEPKYDNFTFIGLLNNQIRSKVYWALVSAKAHSKAPSFNFKAKFNTTWTGPSVNIKDNIVEAYRKNLQDNLYSLAIPGSGKDSARIYEAMAYGRCPIMVGEHLLVNEDQHDISFIHKVDPNLSIDDMAYEFKKVYQKGRNDAIERGKAAQKYFRRAVQPYFADPTKQVLEWLKRIKV